MSPFRVVIYPLRLLAVPDLVRGELAIAPTESVGALLVRFEAKLKLAMGMSAFLAGRADVAAFEFLEEGGAGH